MPSPLHPAALAIDQLLAQCEVRRQRRSGPGGQHRNKVETAVVLVHQPTGVRAEASERRSQDLNQQMAVQRLRIRLALAVRSVETDAAEKVPLTTQSSELWRSRVRGGKISVSGEHADFPALLAEALDTLVAQRFDMPAAAAALQCSASQLLKFLKIEPEALQWVNAERGKVDLRPLR